MLQDLKGKRVLITGGSRGIGAATAELFAEAGVHVAFGYRTRKAEAEELEVSLQQKYGIRTFSFSSDISTLTGAEELVNRSVQALGGLDLFVGNAGIWCPQETPLQSMSDDQWHRTIRENLDSVFYTTRAVIRSLSDNGRIVLVSSTAGQRGEAFHSDYAASKGAMISFVKSLAQEVGKRGINVNCVAPGWVDTEMCERPYSNGGRERIIANIPIGRIATPRDTAGPIVFLCSDLARHITGEILNVNGGSVLCG